MEAVREPEVIRLYREAEADHADCICRTVSMGTQQSNRRSRVLQYVFNGCADCARNDLSVNQGELEVIRQNEKITLCISGRIDSWNLDVS